MKPPRKLKFPFIGLDNLQNPWWPSSLRLPPPLRCPSLHSRHLPASATATRARLSRSSVWDLEGFNEDWGTTQNGVFIPVCFFFGERERERESRSGSVARTCRQPMVPSGFYFKDPSFSLSFHYISTSWVSKSYFEPSTHPPFPELPTHLLLQLALLLHGLVVTGALCLQLLHLRNRWRDQIIFDRSKDEV